MHRCLHNNQQYAGNITENWLLTWECSHGNWGNHGIRILCGQCADDENSQVPVDDVMWKLQKTITQTNRTNESHKMITQDKMISCPRMEMMNDAFRCS